MKKNEFEKEEFIKNKKQESNFSENKKIYKPKLLVFACIVVVILLFYSIMSANQRYLVELTTAISILLIAIFILFSMLRYDYKGGEYIIEEFVKDFSKKYKKIDFLPNEIPESIMNDLSILLKYDIKLGMNEIIDYFYNNCGEFKILEKYNINSKDTYLGATISTIRRDYSRSVAIPYIMFTIVRKTKIDGRLQIETLINDKIDDNILYGDVLADKIKYVSIYDVKYFENIEYALSENFYKKNFPKQMKIELIELNGNIISKLVDIYMKYNIKYQIIIKDNCLRINSFIKTSKFLGEEYDILYNLEKANDEIIKIFEEYEQNKIIEK